MDTDTLRRRDEARSLARDLFSTFMLLELAHDAGAAWARSWQPVPSTVEAKLRIGLDAEDALAPAVSYPAARADLDALVDYLRAAGHTIPEYWLHFLRPAWNKAWADGVIGSRRAVAERWLPDYIDVLAAIERERTAKRGVQDALAETVRDSMTPAETVRRLDAANRRERERRQQRQEQA